MSPAPAAASHQRRAPTIGVLALQGDVREHVAILKEVGARAVTVRRPSDLETVDGLVIPGGESTTISMLLESSGLVGPLGSRLEAGMPVLGTCAGMILLAREIVDGRPDQLRLGVIDLSVRRNAFGRQVESFEADLDVKGIDGGPMHAVFIRAPFVEQVGDGVDVLASVDLGASPGGAATVAGAAGQRPVVCQEGNVVVAAFHPELTGDGRLHELLIGLVLAVGD